MTNPASSPPSENYRVQHNLWVFLFGKYARTSIFLILALVLSYFLKGALVFLTFLGFVLLFTAYLALRGNWLLQLNPKGVVSGNLIKREQVNWQDLDFIVLNLQEQQLYLRAGARARLVNFQTCAKVHQNEIEQRVKHWTAYFHIDLKITEPENR